MTHVTAADVHVAASDVAPASPPPVAQRKAGARRRRTDAGTIGLRIVVVAVAAVFAVPLGYLVLRGPAAGDGFWSTLLGGDAAGPLARSLLLAGAVTASTAVLGTAAAWAVVRTDAPGRRWWAVVLALPLVLPSYIGAFTLRAALAPGGLVDAVTGLRMPAVQGFWAAFGLLTLLSYPYVYLVVAARLRQLPASLEESARLLGRGSGATFAGVVLPQIRPAVVAGSLLVFLYVVSDFGAVTLLRYDTLTRSIFADLLDRPRSMALALVLAVVALLVVVAERAVAARTVAPEEPLARGRRGLVLPLGRARWGVAAALGLLAATALGAPLAVLVYWAVRGMAAGAAGVDAGSLVEPVLNSTLAGVLAALAAVVALMPVAYLSARHRDRVAGAANALVVAGFALPGLVIALALVVATVRAPGPLGALYQSLPLLVAAYVVHFGAQSLRAAEIGVTSVPPVLGDAARTLGASRARRLLRVELPLQLPALLAGGGLVLLSTLKELPATLLLAPPGFPTLATDVWTATQDALWGHASTSALALVALSAVLTWLLVLRRSDALA